jgi:hypothetical protein
MSIGRFDVDQPMRSGDQPMRSGDQSMRSTDQPIGRSADVMPWDAAP